MCFVYIYRTFLSHMANIFISEFIAISISYILWPCIKIRVSPANIIESVVSDRVVR